MFSYSAVFFLSLPVVVDGHGFLKRYVHYSNCMHQDKRRFSYHCLLFYMSSVQGPGTMLLTRRHGGQLTRTLQNPKAGELVSVASSSNTFISSLMYYLWLFHNSSPQCLNKGGSGAVCGMVSDQSYDFPLSGVNTPLWVRIMEYPLVSSPLPIL